MMRLCVIAAAIVALCASAIAGDDTAKVQALIDAGVVIPAREYEVNAAIGVRPKDRSTLDLSGVTLIHAAALKLLPARK